MSPFPFGTTVGPFRLPMTSLLLSIMADKGPSRGWATRSSPSPTRKPACKWETRSLPCLLALLGKREPITRSTPCLRQDRRSAPTRCLLWAAHMPPVVACSHGSVSPSLSDAWGSIISALLTSPPQSHLHAPNKAIHRRQETPSAPKAVWSDVTREQLHGKGRATPPDVGLGTMTKTKHLARGYSVSLREPHSFFPLSVFGKTSKLMGFDVSLRPSWRCIAAGPQHQAALCWSPPFLAKDTERRETLWVQRGEGNVPKQAQRRSSKLWDS